MDIGKIKQLKVLYVEDEISLRDITGNAIRSVVNLLDVANNGQEGLLKFKKNRYDIVISDLSMPILDGMGMINQIRKDDKTTPIIVTTAFNSGDKNIQDLLKIPNTHYMMKPVDMIKLFETISLAIS